MKTKIFFLLLCFLSLNVMGQGNVQGTITRNKCKTCRQVISRCPYKGKHPTKPNPTPKPKPTPKPTPKVEPQQQRTSTYTPQIKTYTANGV